MSIDKITSATVAPIVGPSVGPTSVGHARKPAVTVTPSIEAIAERLEAYMKSVSRSLEFRVDAGSGRTVISVRDSDTGELIRQIPGEEVLRLAQMADDQTVVLLNEKV
jgi:flagellar protein FlaG